jgi:hypothetical protein
VQLERASEGGVGAVEVVRGGGEIVRSHARRMLEQEENYVGEEVWSERARW